MPQNLDSSESTQPPVSKFTDTTAPKSNEQLSGEIIKLSSNIEMTLLGGKANEASKDLFDDTFFDISAGLSARKDEVVKQMDSLKTAVESIDYSTLPVEHIGKLAQHLKRVGNDGREMIDHMNTEMKKIQIERQNIEIDNAHAEASNIQPSASKFTDTTPASVTSPAQPTNKASPEQDKLNRKLSAAAWQGDLEEFNELLNDGAEITNDQHYKEGILARAVLGGNLEIVDKIIASGIDVNQPNAQGKTPMMVLMETSPPLTMADTVASNRDRDNNIRQHEEQTKILHALINAENIDINKSDNQGNTPAIIAAENGDQDRLNILIEAKADLDHQNKHGSTALHRALDNDFLQIAETIIDTKPNMDKVDKKGFSPLAMVVPYNDHNSPALLDISEKMVKNGASIDVAEQKVGSLASQAFTKLREVLSSLKSTISNVAPQQKSSIKLKT